MTIPDCDETTIRFGCAEMATCLNQLREEPSPYASDIVADAALIEHYVTNGYTLEVVCDGALKATLGG